MRKQTKVWITKDKRRIRICDMTDEHLVNTIRMLQRNAEARRIRDSIYMVYCTPPNGDVAQLAFDQACDEAWSATWEDRVHPIYSSLESDAIRRGLEVPQQPERFDIEAQMLLKMERLSKSRQEGRSNG